MSKPGTTYSKNIFLIIISILVSILIFELFFAVFFPYKSFGSATEMFWERRISHHKPWLTVDSEFGFRPLLEDIDVSSGIETVYNKYGIMKKSYIPKNDKKAVLFIGDSVTEAGFLMDELKKRYGNDKYVFWNAGVGSFNTVQEIRFFETYNYKAEPDIIVLGFHLNDLETTPVAFRDTHGKIVIYAPHLPVRYINETLYRYSRLYRAYIGYVYRQNSETYKQQIVNEVKTSLEKLRDGLEKKQRRCIVMIYPICRDYETWEHYEKYSYAVITSLCDELNVEYYDLFSLMKKAAEQNIVLHSFDTLHPSRELSSFWAEYFYDNDLFSAPIQ